MSCPALHRPTAFFEPLEDRRLLSVTYFVSPSGSDSNAGTDVANPWRTIQKAANTALPGSTVRVKAGVYNESVIVRVSGKAGQFITFQGETGAIIDGGARAGRHVLDLSNRSYVKVTGFEIRNGKGTSTDDASGIRIEGKGDHLEIRSNRIHSILGQHAMGITVYGSDAASGIHDLVIDNNEVFNCQPGWSETVTLNGNVYGFRVTNNRIHDNNNIGIDAIGGEGVCADPAKDQARSGVIAGNRVWNCKSSNEGGFAAGIYVDGGRDIVIEKNRVWQCNLGVEVGAENAGRTASNITVRNNVLYANDKAGLAFGGYDASVGRTTSSRFTGNTIYGNGTHATSGYSQIWVQWASNCVVENNIVYATAGKRVLYFEQGASSTVKLNYNLYYRPAGSTAPLITFDGDRDFTSFSAYQTAKGRDLNSIFADPKFVSLSAADFHLSSTSPAINKGNAAYVVASGETDIDGGARKLGGRVDIGADEKA